MRFIIALMFLLLSNVSFAEWNEGDDLCSGDPTDIVTVGEYTFPCIDGSADEVLATDGAGVTYWTTGGGGSSPLTTQGDLYTYTTEDARLAVGTDGYLLSANSATATGLEWITAPSGLPSSTTGQTLYASATDTWSASSNIFNDNTNVGIGTTTPLQKLDIGGQFWFDTTNSQFNTQPYTTTDAGSGESGISNTTYQDKDCSTLTGWTDVSSGGGTTTVTTDGTLDVFQHAVSASNDYAFVTLATGYTTGDVTVTSKFKPYSTWGTGTTSDVDGYHMDLWSGTNELMSFIVAGNGIYRYTGSGTTSVLMKAFTFVASQYYEVSYEYYPDTETIDIFVDGTTIETGLAYPTISGTGAQGDLRIGSWGGNYDCYTDYIKVGDAMEIAGYQTLQNTSTAYGSHAVAPIGSAYHATYLSPTNDSEGNLEVANNAYILGDGQIDGELTVDTDAIKTDAGNVGIGTTTPDQTLEVIGTASFGDDDTNNLTIADDGFVTYNGNAKYTTSSSFTFNYSKITGQGAPTLVYQGVFSGFSLPIYDADDEELTTCDCAIGAWDGVTDPIIYIGGWLDTANTDKNFNLQVSVETADYATNEVVPTTTNDYPVETTTGTWAQYTGFKAQVTIDASVVGLEVGKPLSIRIRRIDASADEITGEVVIEGAQIVYTCNKNGGDTE